VLNTCLDFSFVHTDLNPLVRSDSVPLISEIKTNIYVYAGSCRLRLPRSTSRVTSCRGIVRSFTGSNTLFAKNADSPEHNLTGTGPKVCSPARHLALIRAYSHSRFQMLTTSIIHPSSTRIPRPALVGGATPQTTSRSRPELLLPISCGRIPPHTASVGTTLRFRHRVAASGMEPRP